MGMPFHKENCISDLRLKFEDDPEKIAGIDQQDIVNYLHEYSCYEEEYMEYLIENLYVYLIDFIYFDNQSEFIGYSIKKIFWRLWDIVNIEKEPYISLKKKNDKYIRDAIFVLHMSEDEKYDPFKTKKHMENESEEEWEDRSKKFNEYIDNIVSNSEISLDNLIDKNNWMQVLFNYSKDRRYVG